MCSPPALLPWSLVPSLFYIEVADISVLQTAPRVAGVAEQLLGHNSSTKQPMQFVFMNLSVITCCCGLTSAAIVAVNLNVVKCPIADPQTPLSL